MKNFEDMERKLMESGKADRVRAMISLAHPQFRDQLTEEAKQYGLIR